jgi:hypothetical protein
MNNKNKIVNLGYQLATIIIELMLLLLLNMFSHKQLTTKKFIPYVLAIIPILKSI